MTNKPELTDELHYGDNVLWFLNELASFEPDDIDNNDFDVYGEHESGAEGTASVGIVELAADAVKLITKLQAELQERRKADNAEPVLYAMRGANLDTDAISTCKIVVDGWVDEWNQERKPGEPEYKTVPLYITPQLALNIGGSSND